MSTRLSSRWTPFYKFIAPALAIGGMGVGTWVAFVHPQASRLPDGMDPAYGWVLMAAIGVVVAAFMWWMLAPLKALELDGDDLVISNFRTEIRVPLANVASISGPSVSNPKRYTLRFEESTEFGRRVTFLPPMQWTLLRLGDPEEVVELRAAWESARQKGARRR